VRAPDPSDPASRERLDQLVAIGERRQSGGILEHGEGGLHVTTSVSSAALRTLTPGASVPTAEEFHRDLEDLGFRFVQEGRGGILQYSRRLSTYLTAWVHHDRRAETVLVTWEHAIGEYLNGLGLQVGSNEPLNQYLFPQRDARGPADAAFVVGELDRIESVLGAIDLLEGEG
jgi:hypothetical protein